MALITCPECGKQVSDKAAYCPHCGIEIKKKLSENKAGQRRDKKKRRRNIIIVIVSICVASTFAVLAYLYLGDTTPEQPKQLTLEEYEQLSNDFVASLPSNYTVLTAQINEGIQKVYFTDFDFDGNMYHNAHGDFFIDVYDLATKDTITLLRWKDYFGDNGIIDDYGWYIATSNGEQKIVGGSGGGISDFRVLNNKLLIIGGLNRYEEGEIFTVSYNNNEVTFIDTAKPLKIDDKEIIAEKWILIHEGACMAENEWDVVNRSYSL